MAAPASKPTAGERLSLVQAFRHPWSCFLTTAALASSICSRIFSDASAYSIAFLPSPSSFLQLIKVLASRTANVMHHAELGLRIGIVLLGCLGGWKPHRGSLYCTLGAKCSRPLSPSERPPFDFKPSSISCAQRSVNAGELPIALGAPPNLLPDRNIHTLGTGTSVPESDTSPANETAASPCRPARTNRSRELPAWPLS
jgi:hypothetical protein